MNINRNSNLDQYQGRTPEQVNNNYKVLGLAVKGFLIIILILAACGVFGLEL